MWIQQLYHNINSSFFATFSDGSPWRMFPLRSGTQAVSRSPEPAAICSGKTDQARDAKTHFLSIRFYLITPQGIVLDFFFQVFFFFFFQNASLETITTTPCTCFLCILERLTWRDWTFSRVGGEHVNTGTKVRGGEVCESGGEKDALGCFLITAQKMNMSGRVVFGKGRLPPKHLSFILPQTDPLRKGGRPAGGKKRLFSFSIRCRVGIIRGRTKGKPLECNLLIFFLSFNTPKRLLNNI